MRKKYGALFAMLLLTILPSCAALTTAQSANPKGSFCDLAQVITWVDEDSEETRIEIREHNCIGASECGWPIKDCPRPQ